MSEKMMKKSKLMLVGLLSIALTVLTIWGCGGTDFNSPSTAVTATKTANALIEPGVLKQWMDQGLVNKKGGYERVVILDVSDAANYAAEHIPGAVNVNINDLMTTRLEGPAKFGSMVATGAQMDSIIQKAGIDKYTTIVFTTSAAEMNANTLWNLTRGYVTFRYWGYPKDRLKVLNGGNKSWPAEDLGRTMTSVVPQITPSSYGIAQGSNHVQADLRASLSEMMDAVEAQNKDFIDGRGSVAGGTTDLIDSSKYVVFEGRLKNTNFNDTSTVANSRILAYTNLVGKDKKFKSLTDYVDVNDDDGDNDTSETLPGLIKLLNIQSDTAYTLCRAGNIASVLFFAIDGYAYYDESKKAVWYDGSWGQWGLMAKADQVSAVRGSNAGGKLTNTGGNDFTIWNTIPLTDLQANDPGTTTAVTKTAAYNVDFITTLGPPIAYRPVIDMSSRLWSTAPSREANQIEDADKIYISPPPATSSNGGTSGGGGC